MAACLSAAPAGAAPPPYLAAYAEGVLDGRFADLRVTVLGAQDGEVLLAAQSCLPEATRLAIEQALRAAGRIQSVRWRDFKTCPAAEAAPAGPPPAAAATAAPVIEPLPPYEIFEPLLADPRQPQFSMRYQRYHSAVDSFNAAMVSFGEYFGFASGLWRDASVSQIGLQGAVFGLFNLDTPSSDLVNADYWIGIPLSYRNGPWSYLARIYHQSSHLGDEFLLGNPGINRINLSYEDAELLVSLDLNSLRLYGGGGYIFHSEPKLAPWHAQGGVEGRKENVIGNLDLVAAADLQAHEERDWHWNRAYQLGLAFNRRGDREVRLMLEHFRGFSPNGQFYRERLRYTGLGLFFDL